MPKSKKRPYTLTLSLKEANLIVEGLHMREMWGSGYPLADRIQRETGLKWKEGKLVVDRTS